MRLPNQTKSEVAEPDWVPLSRAIFECFTNGEDSVVTSPLPYQSAGAPQTVEISTAAQTFKFMFPNGSIFEGKPWQFLYDDEYLPQNALAAAFIHKSTKELWERMKLNFNKKVSEGAVCVFARHDSFRAPFAPITSNQWPNYTVSNWETGAAAAVDGTLIFSVLGKIVAKQITRAGRKPQYDQDQINGEVLRAVKRQGFPDRNGESGWQGRADVERLIADFVLKTTNQEPVRSTLQGLANRALAAAKASLSDN